MNNNLVNNDINTALPPEYVDITKWAEAGYQWQGSFELSQFPRLSEILTEDTELQDKFPSILQFAISRSDGVYWFEFVVKASVKIQCQRCLQQMDFILDKKTKLAILEDKSQVGLLVDDNDWLLVEDVSDLIGREIRLPVATIIEDELLLSLPLAPKHEINDVHCVPVEVLTEEDLEPILEEKENPFAVLAGLKAQE